MTNITGSYCQTTRIPMQKMVFPLCNRKIITRFEVCGGIVASVQTVVELFINSVRRSICCQRERELRDTGHEFKSDVPIY